MYCVTCAAQDSRVLRHARTEVRAADFVTPADRHPDLGITVSAFDIPAFVMPQYSSTRSTMCAQKAKQGQGKRNEKFTQL